MQCATGLPACRRLTCAAPDGGFKFPYSVNADVCRRGCSLETHRSMNDDASRLGAAGASLATEP
jgi:hypothetical protein